MRDLLYIAGLMAAICILAADFPVSVVDGLGCDCVQTPFASYVELSPSVHAACLESARTSWQVRSGSRGRPVIGSLDSGIPLLTDSLPAREKVEFRRMGVSVLPVGPANVEVYSLLPGSEGSDISVFSSRPQGVVPDDCAKGAAFPKDEMLSVDQFRKLKEIMQ